MILVGGEVGCLGFGVVGRAMSLGEQFVDVRVRDVLRVERKRGRTLREYNVVLLGLRGFR